MKKNANKNKKEKMKKRQMVKQCQSLRFRKNIKITTNAAPWETNEKKDTYLDKS